MQSAYSGVFTAFDRLDRKVYSLTDSEYFGSLCLCWVNHPITTCAFYLSSLRSVRYHFCIPIFQFASGVN